MANFSCFLMMFQHQKIDENWAPNSRAFHAVGGPFTQWEVLFTEIHGDSRVIWTLPGYGAESRAIKKEQRLLCFAACSLFYVLCFVFMLCLCSVLQFAFFFAFYVLVLCYVSAMLCSLLSILRSMFCFSVMFCNLLSMLCFKFAFSCYVSVAFCSLESVFCFFLLL